MKKKYGMFGSPTVEPIEKEPVADDATTQPAEVAEATTDAVEADEA